MFLSRDHLVPIEDCSVLVEEFLDCCDLLKRVDE